MSYFYKYLDVIIVKQLYTDARNQSVFVDLLRLPCLGDAHALVFETARMITHLPVIKLWSLQWQKYCLQNNIPGWWFEIFVVFTPTWGNDKL